jgi:hypothetical protein
LKIIDCIDKHCDFEINKFYSNNNVQFINEIESNNAFDGGLSSCLSSLTANSNIQVISDSGIRDCNQFNNPFLCASSLTAKTNNDVIINIPEDFSNNVCKEFVCIDMDSLSCDNTLSEICGNTRLSDCNQYNIVQHNYITEQGVICL